VKLTVTGPDGPVDNLAALGQLVEEAMRLVQTAGPGDAAKANIKTRITPTGKVRSLEVSW
jgi:hypothetical protein